MFVFIKPTYVLASANIPDVLQHIIWEYMNVYNKKAHIIQKTWARYTACNVYIEDYAPHIQYVVEHMPRRAEHIFRYVRQSNSGVASWCCPRKFYSNMRISYKTLSYILYMSRRFAYKELNEREIQEARRKINAMQRALEEKY